MFTIGQPIKRKHFFWIVKAGRWNCPHSENLEHLEIHQNYSTAHHMSTLLGVLVNCGKHCLPCLTDILLEIFACTWKLLKTTHWEGPTIGKIQTSLDIGVHYLSHYFTTFQLKEYCKQKWEMLYHTTVDIKVTPPLPIWLIKKQFCCKSQVVVLVELFNNSFPVLIGVLLLPI